MSYEIRKLIDKVKNWKQFLNKNDNTTREINHILSENGFVIQDIYDVENIKGLISSLKLNEVMPIYWYKAVDFELGNSVGVIIFSTDLDSTIVKAEIFSDMVKFFFDSKWKAFLNRLNVSDKLRNILLDKYTKPEYTLGRNFTGSYKNKNGITINKNSFTIGLVGVDSDILILIASEICKEFKQETVMVRDFNKSKVYFVNDKEYIKNDG
jgi:hypothetical protein